jgi:biotin operon repressor
MNAVTPRAKFDLANRILLDRTLTPVTRLVGWFIADHINTQRGYAWPPQEAIAAGLGIDERTVRRAIKPLSGYFAVDKSRRQHEYRITTTPDILPAIECSTPDNLSAIGPSIPDNLSTTPDNLSKIPGRDVPPSLEILSNPLMESPKKKKGKSKKEETEIPESWTPNQQSIQKGEALGLTGAEISREVQRFRNKAKEKARTAVRWDAAFDNWLIKAAEFMGRSPPSQAKQEGYSAEPCSAEFQAWRTHARDNGRQAFVRELDSRALEGRPFVFDARWPPGHSTEAA